MIVVENLSVSYGDHNVLQNISTTFEGGRVHGIVGLNGSGKTTFFNTLSAFLKPTLGSIKREGSTLTTSEVAFLETGNYFYPGLTGNEYLAVFPKTNQDFDLKVLQELFQLPLNELAEGYSTGMKKKLALLAILKQDKPVYLLDEPFNGLDLESNKMLEVIIMQLKQKGKTVFLSSHILEPLLNVCDKIHHLNKGKIERTFNPDEFSGLDHYLFAELKESLQSRIEKAF